MASEVTSQNVGRFWILVVVVSLLLSFSTVYTQVRAHRVKFLRTAQLRRHWDVLEDKARNPWQYRILSEWLVEVFIRGGRLVGIVSPVFPFILFRFLQNLAIFLLAALFYRRLGLSRGRILIGLILLAWGMSYAFRDSDLEFSTYSDTIFYLIAAFLIVSHHDWWIAPLTLLAAFNRETSALIPWALLICRWGGERSPEGRKGAPLLIFIISLALYLFVFFALRLSFQWRPLAHAWGHRPGFDMLNFNLTHTLTWAKLMWTLNILPLLCVFTFRSWPETLKRLCLSLLPLWFVFHFFYLFIPEIRLMLVPLALIFVPGTLMLEDLEEGDPNLSGGAADAS